LATKVLLQTTVANDGKERHCSTAATSTRFCNITSIAKKNLQRNLCCKKKICNKTSIAKKICNKTSIAMVEAPLGHLIRQI